MCNREKEVLRLSAAALLLSDLITLSHLQQLSLRSRGQDKLGTRQLILDNSLYNSIDFCSHKSHLIAEVQWVLIT